MRWPSIVSCLVLSASFGSGCSPADDGRTDSGERADLILIVVDTLRYDSVADPEGRLATPHLDALAADGVSFTRAYSHAPMTLPSHMSLFSSRLPFETGVLNNGWPIPEDVPILAEWLNDRGYETRAVVSLGSMNTNREASFRRGMDHYDVDFWHIDRAPDVLARIRASLAARDPSRKLFFFAHFSDPHEPYNAHGTTSAEVTVRIGDHLLGAVDSADMHIWEDTVRLGPGPHTIAFASSEAFRLREVRYQLEGQRSRAADKEEAADRRSASAVIDHGAAEERDVRIRFLVQDVPRRAKVPQRYDLEVEYVDRYLGEFMKELRRAGLYDSSLIVFTSDHGEALGEHGAFGHVQNVDEAMTHVPLIVKPPAGSSLRSELEERREGLVGHIDVVPTILEALGMPALPGQRGFSLADDEPRRIVSQTHRPQARHDKVSLLDDRYRITFVVDEDRFEMFDIVTDPAELVDVFESRASERPEWIARLRSIARVAAEHAEESDELDEQTLRRLEAIGY